MSATVKIGPHKARIEGYVWTCEDKALQRLLNALLSPFGPSGSDPNPDASAAEAAVKTLGGRVLQADPTEYVEGRVY